MQLRRVGLPEILDTNGQASANVTDKSEARRTFACGRKQPSAFGIGPFLYRKTIRIWLNQFEVVPYRPVADHSASLIVHLSAVRNAKARELRRVNVFAVGVGNDSGVTRSTNHRLDRLGPEAIAFAGEPHMPVLDLLAHRNGERRSEPVNKVLFLVAIKEDGMNHPHRRLTGIKIQPNMKRQPLASRLGPFVNAFEFHDSSYRSRLFDGHLFDEADKFLAGLRILGVCFRPVLQYTNQLSRCGDLTAVYSHRVKEIRSAGFRYGAF